MPKGTWDRTKTKEQRAAERDATVGKKTAPKAKKVAEKKAAVKAKSPAPKKVTPVKKAKADRRDLVKEGGTEVAQGRLPLHGLAGLREHARDLAHISSSGTFSSGVKNKLEKEIEETIDSMREYRLDAFPRSGKVEVVEPKLPRKLREASAPLESRPVVPFDEKNVAAHTNGVAHPTAPAQPAATAE